MSPFFGLFVDVAHEKVALSDVKEDAKKKHAFSRQSMVNAAWIVNPLRFLYLHVFTVVFFLMTENVCLLMRVLPSPTG